MMMFLLDDVLITTQKEHRSGFDIDVLGSNLLEPSVYSWASNPFSVAFPRTSSALLVLTSYLASIMLVHVGPSHLGFPCCVGAPFLAGISADLVSRYCARS